MACAAAQQGQRKGEGLPPRRPFGVVCGQSSASCSFAHSLTAAPRLNPLLREKKSQGTSRYAQRAAQAFHADGGHLRYDPPVTQGHMRLPAIPVERRPRSGWNAARHRVEWVPAISGIRTLAKKTRMQSHASTPAREPVARPRPIPMLRADPFTQNTSRRVPAHPTD
jgi:hypothetical protein